MKNWVLAALPLVAVAAFFAAGASAQGQPTLLEIGGAHFPDRSYVLTLPPGTVVSPDQLRVQENGREGLRGATQAEPAARCDLV